MISNSITYSQNFIKNTSIIKDLIELSSITKEDTVIEIGPGTGVITNKLSNYANKVIAIEKDTNLFNQLVNEFKSTNNVDIIKGDFLNFEFSKYKNYKVFSNIPFNITSDIIKTLTDSLNPPQDIYLFVQKEAALRFIGSKDNKDNNKETMVSLLLKPWWNLEIIYNFNKTDFGPTPQIDIVLLRIQLRDKPLININNKNLYRDFIAYSFTTFKPTLKLGLRKIFSNLQFKILSENLKFPLDAIPTDLNFNQWQELFLFSINLYRNSIINGAYYKNLNLQKNIQKNFRTRVDNDWKIKTL